MIVNIMWAMQKPIGLPEIPGLHPSFHQTPSIPVSGSVERGRFIDWFCICFSVTGRQQHVFKWLSAEQSLSLHRQGCRLACHGLLMFFKLIASPKSRSQPVAAPSQQTLSGHDAQDLVDGCG